MSPATQQREQTDVLVVGAGQAGLALGRALQQGGARFIIAERAERLGESWSTRWDSLRLFTPRAFAHLPGRKHRRGTPDLPTKDHMASYLADYAEHFALPVRLSSEVVRLHRHDDGFCAHLARGAVLRARYVAVASGPYTAPAVPAMAAGLDPSVHQLHSSEYRGPDDVPPGEVLIVGGANTGAQLATELQRAGRRVTLAASTSPWFLPTRVLGVGLYSLLQATGMLRAPAGGSIERYLQRRGDPIVGTDLRTMLADGRVGLRPRMTGAGGRVVTFGDATTMSVSTVLWATGYRPALDWLQVEGAVDERGMPVHARGVSPVPGLVWVGLPWQSRMDSGIVRGVGRDAREILPVLLAGLEVPPGTARPPRVAALP